MSEVLEAADPIAITIDGKDVREVPGPTGIPYFGNYLEIYPDHLGNHQRLFEKYGPLIVTNNMGSKVYQTNDPKLSTIFLAEGHYFSKHIVPGHPLYPIKIPEAGVFLGDTDTEEWRQAHKFLPPALGPKAVRHYAPTMQKSVEDAFKVLDKLDEDNEGFNVYQYMLKLGSQAVGKLVLGMDFEHFTSPDAPLHEMVYLIAHMLELNKRISSMGAWYANMPFGDPKALRQTRARIDELLDESIARAAKGKDGDLELQDAALKAENVVGMSSRICKSTFTIWMANIVIRLLPPCNGQQGQQAGSRAVRSRTAGGHRCRLHNHILPALVADLQHGQVSRQPGAPPPGAG